MSDRLGQLRDRCPVCPFRQAAHDECHGGNHGHRRRSRRSRAGGDPRTHAPWATDFWDGNWVVSPISVKVGGFTADVPAGLRMDELARFRDQLRSVYDHLSGVATLESLEDWISMTIECTRTGRLIITGEVTDNPASDNLLRFELDGLDQSYLPPALDALDACLREFPVLGSPGR